MEKKVSFNIRDIPLPDFASDPGDKEISDDDDDDRNHKHRRRDMGSQSMEGDRQEQYFSAPYRRRAKPNDKAHSSWQSNFHSQYSTDRELSSKPHHYMTNFSRFPIEASQRHPSFPGDLGANRGRSRDSGSWCQRDFRVNKFDIAPQMVPQGPKPPFFPGRGLHSGLNTQNAPWAGGFGLIPGMPNGATDPIHPLGLNNLNPSLNIGVPRQRCRDFEERGFCLQGDMCPMEHGVNRIVIEDVQSLSQFNLPVSLPSAQLTGNPAGSGSTVGLQVNASPSVLIDNNGFGTDADGYALSGAPDEVFDGNVADVYDPDQPLWNNDCPQTSPGLLSLQTPSSPSSRLARSSCAAFGDQSTSSSVWGRTNASESRLVSRVKVDSGVTSSEFGSATKERCEVYTNNQTTDHHGKKSNTGELPDSSSKIQKHTGHSFRNPAQKAVRSLYVNHIPLKDNKKEALLYHFKKFGEVVDIYIPPNTEHAFVQFSKREEAERALQSPDAIMGNRFIKLLWAFRDSFFPGGVGGNNMSRMPGHMQETSAAPHHTTANTSKTNIQHVVPMVSSGTLSSEAKQTFKNGPKVLTAPSVHKKLENLELMQEEVRKKQELLEQRRKEFRQQLDKLQKNATGIKGEVQASKKLKVGGAEDSPKSETPIHSKLQPVGADMPAGGSLHKPQLVESANLQSLKTKLSAASQELSKLKLAAFPPAFNGSPYPANRYKLDNRPTSFRVSAPLPVEFANVNAVRDHFAVFGDLSNVDLENPDVQGDKDKCCEKSTIMSARVSFKTRQAAERAFVNGKSWNGHSLQLTWLMPTKSFSPKSSGTNSLDSSGGRVSSVSVAKETASGTEIQSMEKSTCDVSQESPATFSAGTSLEASRPGSTDSEVVDKEENSKSVICEIGEAQGDA